MNAIIDDTRRFMIFWNPKCACSYLKCLFLLYKNEYNDDFEAVHDKIGYGWPGQKYSYIDRNNLGKYKDYIKILFVRDPYKRLVSGFIEKIPKWIKEGKLSPDYYKNFEDFVDKLKINNYKVMNGSTIVDDSHFTPQFSGDYSIVTERNWKFFNVYDIKDIPKVGKMFSSIFGADIDDALAYQLGRRHSVAYSDAIISNASVLPMSYWLETKQFPTYKSFYQDWSFIQKINSLYNDDFNKLIDLGFKYTL